jgi:cation:H+ antiporter
MWPFIAAVVAGLALLVWSADRFVHGAAATARNLGVSPLVIGITIVGFGTSAPEMLISGIAAWQGNPQLALGNAVGSNIANIALILGATALIYPLSVHSQVLRRELPVMLGAMLLVVALSWNGVLGRWEGFALGLLMLLVLAGVVVTARRAREPDPLLQEFAEEVPEAVGLGAALAWLAVGFLLLLAASRALVWGAVGIAQALGVSDLVIGLTIVAIGTSLPELAASIAGALKKEPDIVVGNVIGSNIFNTLAVLGIAAAIRPVPVSAAVLRRDYALMLGSALVLWGIVHGWTGRHGHINRIEGALLLAGFVAYQWVLYHGARP